MNQAEAVFPKRQLSFLDENTVTVLVQVDMINRTTDIDLSNYVENGEWQLLSITVKRNVVYYACCLVSIRHRLPDPSRATAEPRETFSRGPKHFHGAPLGRKFLNFYFQNATFWRTLYFWLTAGPPKRRGARGSLPPPLPHLLDGPVSWSFLHLTCRR